MERDPLALGDGTRTVTVVVHDPVGNPGTAGQLLTVDTVAPSVVIAGGATALTSDATPDISGSADVAPGTSVTVTLADETLTAPVQGNAAWSVTAARLADGPHRVVLTATDEAGNPASATQMLTVDTRAPAIAIDGGAIATTSDDSPTITGTSDAAAGTVVAVTIGDRTLMSYLQANGTWSATLASLGRGAWTVVAVVADPAGNAGSARQLLTVAAAVASARTIDAARGTAVTRAGRQKVTGSLLSIAVAVTAPAAGGVVATATSRVKIKGGKGVIRLARTTAAVAAGQRVTMRIGAPGSKRAARAAFARIKAAIARGTRVTAKVTVTVVDAAGHRRVFTKTVNLV